MIVDTTVWAAYFNGADSAATRLLDDVLAREEEDVYIVPIVLTEVLQGFRTDAGFRRAERALAELPVLWPELGTYRAAAALFRALRRKGVTVRGAVDVLIAQTCIEADQSLLATDRDFVHIARHAPLRLALR